AHKPWRVPQAEDSLTGQTCGDAAANAAADAVLQGAHGQGHNDFKIPLTRRVIAGTLEEAAQGRTQS
ncbi:MAG: FAD-binding molybdopterin dehydrogenase, partial [Ramlibacter sp.]|nr:FAD-binding molybdopterin dehydrogenase [Ramlibacter sp.]